MLICPQCDFENPNHHQFCQNCGTSLVLKTCQECGAEVEVSAANCSNCGAFTGTVWWSVVADLESLDGLAYLDAANRYQIRESPAWQRSEDNYWEGPVLDHSPYEKVQNTLGSLAAPYLQLQVELAQSLPKVHTTSHQEGWSAILLEDRSQWSLLSDFWGNQHVPLMQVLYWLQQLGFLWSVLAPRGLGRSLLQLTNLRLDEDQSLSLQRLYQDDPEQPASLRQLGDVLANISPPSPWPEVVDVLQQLNEGAIATIESLQNHLKKLQQTIDTGVAEFPEDDFDDADDATSPDLLEPNTIIQTGRISSAHPGGRAGDDAPTVVLPMQLLGLDDVGYTDIGQQRDHNEDNYGIYVKLEKQEHPLGKTIKAKAMYILCDGMGGHAAGEVASSTGVEALKRFFLENWQDELPTAAVIEEGVLFANQVIYDINQQKSSSGSGRMGTTLAMMLLQDTNVAIVHVGDSRVYRITRKGGLEQLTIDHEVGQREIRRGVEPEIAYARPDAYQLTQALGPREASFIKPDIQFFEVNEDTMFILCSDGLSDNNLLEKNWESYLSPLLSSRANLSQGASRLIEFANDFNGHDNITVIFVRVKVQPIQPHPY